MKLNYFKVPVVMKNKFTGERKNCYLIEKTLNKDEAVEEAFKVANKTYPDGSSFDLDVYSASNPYGRDVLKFNPFEEYSKIRKKVSSLL